MLNQQCSLSCYRITVNGQCLCLKAFPAPFNYPIGRASTTTGYPNSTFPPSNSTNSAVHSFSFRSWTTFSANSSFPTCRKPSRIETLKEPCLSIIDHLSLPTARGIVNGGPLGDARSKIKSLLRGRTVGYRVSEELPAWKMLVTVLFLPSSPIVSLFATYHIFNVREWGTMLLKYVLFELRAPCIKTSSSTLIFSQILEPEFFPSRPRNGSLLNRYTRGSGQAVIKGFVIELQLMLKLRPNTLT